MIGGGLGKVLFQIIGLNRVNEIFLLGQGQGRLLFSILLISLILLVLSRFLVSVINKKKYYQLGIEFQGILSLKTEKNKSDFSLFTLGMSLFYLIFIYGVILALYLSGYGAIITFPILLIIGYLFIYKTKSRDSEIGIIGSRKLIDIQYEKNK